MICEKGAFRESQNQPKILGQERRKLEVLLADKMQFLYHIKDLATWLIMVNSNLYVFCDLVLHVVPSLEALLNAREIGILSLPIQF